MPSPHPSPEGRGGTRGYASSSASRSTEVPAFSRAYSAISFASSFRPKARIVDFIAETMPYFLAFFLSISNFCREPLCYGARP